MPTPTYTALASVTLSASASEVVFSGLPQTFRDLILVCEGTASTATGLVFQANGDTGSNYSEVVAYGDGSNPYSSSSSGTSFQVGRFDTNRAMATTQFMDYSATDKHKTMLVRYGSASVATYMRAARWASTSALTSIRITTQSGTFSSGSTFNLFGVIA